MSCRCGPRTGAGCSCHGGGGGGHNMSMTTSTYTRTNGNLVSTAMGEKVEMQGLNDRLAGFMQKVRDMCQNNSASLDPSKYHEMMRMLEAEINKLKNMYEDEINRLRRQLQDASQQAAALANNANSNRGMLGDLQAKLQDELNRARRAEDDINNLHRQLAGKDKDIADLQAALKARDAELSRLRPDTNKMSSELDSLRRQLEAERKARIDAENRAKVLDDKVRFDGKVFGEQQKDLGDRIKAANDIIQTLELKLRQLSNDRDGNIPTMLQRLRDGTAEDMRKFQRETEDALNVNLNTLRKQMDDAACMKDRLARDKMNAEEQARQLQARCNALEGENQGLRNEINALKMALDQERGKHAQDVRDLENQLRAAQGQLMTKVKDFNSARDAQASLNNEISQYRGLLDVGGQTMKTCCSHLLGGQSAGQSAHQGARQSIDVTMSSRRDPQPPSQPPPSYRAVQQTIQQQPTVHFSQQQTQGSSSARGAFVPPNYSVSRVSATYTNPPGCPPGPNCDTGLPTINRAQSARGPGPSYAPSCNNQSYSRKVFSY